MSDQTENDRDVDVDLHPKGDDPAIPAEQIAAQQFVHGLLVFMHRDNEARQGRRVERVMDAIVDTGRPITVSRQRHFWRALSATAAGLLLILGLGYLAGRTGQSAHAIVQASIDASGQAGGRRYSVTGIHRSGDTPSADPIAVLDIRDDTHLLLRVDPPSGHRLILGRDDEGEWAIRRDGTVERFHADRARPSWINLGDSTVLIQTIDQTLRGLDQRYRLIRGEEASLDDGTGRMYARVTAELIALDSTEPERIEFWIDHDSYLVLRMELRWSRQQRFGPGAARPGGPPRRGARDAGNTPGTGERRAPGDLPPRGTRRGAGPLAPRFVNGPPRFGAEAHPPPPEMIVFDLVETREFSPDWFNPERHTE